MSRTSADTVASLTTGHALPRVNLLPPEVHQARKLRKMQLGLGAGVALVAVLVGGVYAIEAQAKSQASDDLATTKAQSVTLVAQKAQYADVPRVLGAIQSAENARQTAMGNDVQWYRYLNDLTYITPKNAWLTSLAVTFNSSATGTNPIAAPSVATITVAGTALQHNDVAAWLAAAAKETGWVDPYFTSSVKSAIGSTPVVTFSSTVDVTAQALSHRYDRKGS